MNDEWKSTDEKILSEIESCKLQMRGLVLALTEVGGFLERIAVALEKADAAFGGGGEAFEMAARDIMRKMEEATNLPKCPNAKGQAK